MPGFAYTVTEGPSVMQLNCAVYLHTEKSNCERKREGNTLTFSIDYRKPESKVY